jgi:hypothetical protein
MVELPVNYLRPYIAAERAPFNAFVEPKDLVWGAPETKKLPLLTGAFLKQWLKPIMPAQ